MAMELVTILLIVVVTLLLKVVVVAGVSIEDKVNALGILW